MKAVADIGQNDASDDGPSLLPGLSSTRISRRGTKIVMTFVSLSLLFAFESKFGSYEGVYIAVLASLVFPGVIIGFIMQVVGLVKRDKEIKRGYTSRANIAEQRPELWGIDYVTLEVVYRPFERP